MSHSLESSVKSLGDLILGMLSAASMCLACGEDRRPGAVGGYHGLREDEIPDLIETALQRAMCIIRRSEVRLSTFNT